MKGTKRMGPAELHSLVDATIEGFNSIVPDGAVSTWGHVDQSVVSPTSREVVLAANWASRRQQEFYLGRTLARSALKSARLYGVDSSILRSEDGYPLFPEGVSGSVSHSRGLVGAVVAKSSMIRMIGLDIERTDRLSDSAGRRVVHEAEAKFAEAAAVNPSILFSLKESFYKAQFPHHQTIGNFKELALFVHAERQQARVQYLSDRFAQELRSMVMAYHLVGRYVLSIAYLEG